MENLPPDLDQLTMAQVVGIFVIGASSTGKSTLCRALESHLKLTGVTVIHITEVARTVMREQGFTRHHVGTLTMQRAIMQAQIKAEKEALQKICEYMDAEIPHDEGTATVVLLCDRCAVDPVVYATMKIEADQVSSLTNAISFQEAVERYGGHAISQAPPRLSTTRVGVRPVVILAGGVKDWQGNDDGVRSLYDPFEVTEYFRKSLLQLGIKYEEVGENIKDIDERVNWALKVSGLGS